MLTSRLPRLGLVLALLASVGAGLSQANAQDAGLARGDAVVTGFSGIRPLDTPVPTGADPLDYFFIDLQGPSAEILSLSGLGAGPNGQLSPAPIKRQITAAQVGQMFGDAANAGHMGDVAVWQPRTGENFDIEGELPPGYHPLGGDIIVDGFTPPHGRPTNLRLHKRALGPCVHWGAGWRCRFAISIRNTGPHWYWGPLQIKNHMPGLPGGSITGVSPPSWGCSGSPASFTCTHGVTFLPVGASRHVLVTVWVPNAAVSPGHCRIRNRARIIFVPGGSVWNTDPGDAADGATATISSLRCYRPPP